MNTGCLILQDMITHWFRTHLLWRQQIPRWLADPLNFCAHALRRNIPQASFIPPIALQKPFHRSIACNSIFSMIFNQIMYENLFESDAAGDQCKFAETVREQSLFEYNELIADIQSSMVQLPTLAPLSRLNFQATNPAVHLSDSHLQ
jgi:hypothetical protein